MNNLYFLCLPVLSSNTPTGPGNTE